VQGKKKAIQEGKNEQPPTGHVMRQVTDEYGSMPEQCRGKFENEFNTKTHFIIKSLYFQNLCKKNK
jgi:hypothetical protein